MLLNCVKDEKGFKYFWGSHPSLHSPNSLNLENVFTIDLDVLLVHKQTIVVGRLQLFCGALTERSAFAHNAVLSLLY